MLYEMKIIGVKLVNYDLVVQIRVKILQRSIHLGGLHILKEIRTRVYLKERDIDL